MHAFLTLDGTTVYLSSLQTGLDSKRGKIHARTHPPRSDQIRSHSRHISTIQIQYNTIQYNSTVQPFERNVQYCCCNGVCLAPVIFAHSHRVEVEKEKEKGKGKTRKVSRDGGFIVYIYTYYMKSLEREREKVKSPPTIPRKPRLFLSLRFRLVYS